MIHYILYFLWVIFLLFGVGGAIYLLHNKMYSESKIGKFSLLIPVFLSFFSFFSILCFTLVFFVGRASNVAQFAGEEGMKWWMFWCDVWPFCLISNIFAFIGCFACLFPPPYSKKYWSSFVFRLMICMGCLLSNYHLVTYFPDA